MQHFWPIGFLLARIWEVEAEGESVIRKRESLSSAQPIFQQKLWQPRFKSCSSLKTAAATMPTIATLLWKWLVWTIGSKEYIIKSPKLRQPNKWLREWMPSCPLVSAGGLDFLLLIHVPEKHSTFPWALFSSTGTKANVFKHCYSNC